MSRRGSTSSIDQRVAPPTSMYSMKRTSAFKRRPYSSIGSSSSSLTPRITTVSILTLSNPAAAAASRPRRTSAWRSKRVRALKRSGCKVSRLTVMRGRPAARSAEAWSASRMPLVVRARSRSAALPASIATRSGRSVRSRGSPPVIRTLSVPSAAKTSTRRSISSKVRMSSRGSQTYSASGMQYWHRRLHRSVTETRRLASGRPSRSRTSIALHYATGGFVRPARPPAAGAVRRIIAPCFGPTAPVSRGSRLRRSSTTAPR